jgi:uncharacterized protein (TIGR04141 family)
MASKRLTIYHLRNVAQPSDALAPDKQATARPLDPASGLDGVFYYTTRPATPPPWLSFVAPLLASPAPPLTTSSASGLLVLQVDGRFYAFSFGYGRALLNPSKIEPQFGLRVALNRIDPRQIRSLDTKTFEDMVVSRATQASKSSELPTFGVDVSRDILRAVTGQPNDDKIGKRLSGSDALVVNVDTSSLELHELCRRCYGAFNDNAYKTDFAWIDHLALVTDSATIDQLNDLLVQQLKAAETSRTHMAMPEPINWEDIDVFKIAGTRDQTYEDLDLDSYLQALGPRCAAITLEILKSRRVSVRFDRTGQFDARWTLYQCLVTEQRLSNQLHVLIEGRWFAVSDSLVGEVDQFANSLPAPTSPLIAAIPGELEADYNRRLANSRPGQMLLLDQKIKRPGGAASGIELCDVFSLDGEFIHVKRKSRSATLSHLFAQGSVSATTFVGDGEFRQQLRALLSTEAPAADRPQWLDLIPPAGTEVDRRRYRISYVVITNSTAGGTDWLPFFSKLNLMQNGRQLKRLGFEVGLSRVSEASA